MFMKSINRLFKIYEDHGIDGTLSTDSCRWRISRV